MRLMGWSLALIFLFFCGNAYALSVNGGKAKKHKNSDNKSGKANQGEEEEAPEKQPAAKASLPAPEHIVVLSTYVFDAASGDLGLSEEQMTKIESAKQDIRAKGEALAKEQADARTAYDAAKKPKEIESALDRVVAAAAECKRFSPQTEFNQALSKILTADQFARYVEMINKR